MGDRVGEEGPPGHVSDAPRVPGSPVVPSPGSGVGTAFPGETTLADVAGLAPGERAELTMKAADYAVLKKLGADEQPEGASVVIAGYLSRLPVPDVLSLVHSTGLEGEITFELKDATKKVYLRGGIIVFATSTLADDRLGEMLLAKGRIDRRTFETASHECVTTHKKLGRILVDRGILTVHDLYAAIVEQIEGIVLSLFAYRDGAFTFTAKPLPIVNPVRLPHAISHYILEGVRMNDELRAALEVVSDRLVVLRPSGKGQLAIADGRPGVERDVAALIDGASPTWEILARSNWSEANTLLALARLLRAGVIEKVRAGEVAGSAKPDLHLVELVNDFLRDVHRSVKAYGGDPAALDGFFDGLKPVYRGIYAGVHLAADGSLDVERIAENVRTHPGVVADTARLLRDALHEIVEFALWVASDQVPEKETARLAQASRVLQGSATANDRKEKP